MAINYGKLNAKLTPRGSLRATMGVSGPLNSDYEALINKPQINGNELIGNKTNEDLGIPTKTSDLDNDLNFVADENYVHTDNNYDDTDKGKVDALGTASTKDVPVSGDASTSEVVLGNDSRLTDDRNAKDVYDWAKAQTKPSYSYSEIQNTPAINNSTITFQKNNQNVDSFTLNQDSNKSINISVPTKTSDLQNDNSFITNTVNNLANYYLKTQTYTQAEVDALIQAAVNGRFQKVNTLPASGEPNIIYLVPKTTPETSNACDEYIWQDNAWELIGSTEIDLSDYVTDEELATALQSYLTTSAFATAIANYYTKTEVGTLLDNKVDKVNGKGLSTYDYDATAKAIVDSVTANLATKVDKVAGKGLSTNDYDNTAKGIVDGVTSALATKVDKVDGKGLSTNDYTTEEKTKLTGISEGANKVELSETNGNIVVDGTEVTVYNDTDIQNAIEDIDDIITTDESTIEGNPINFSTLSSQNAKSTILSVEPIQDLHGYDKPWVGGAGKNKLPDGDTSPIDSSGFTATMNSDGSWNIGGQNTEAFFARIYNVNNTYTFPAGTYNFNTSCSSGSNINGLQIWIFLSIDGGEPSVKRLSIPDNVTITATSSLAITTLAFWHDTPIASFNGKVFLQFELGSTATSWEPYENICPISGRTEIGILGCGKNLLPMTVGGIKSANPNRTWTGNSTVIDNITFTILTDGDGNVTGIKGNGIATGDAQLHIKKAIGLSSGDYIINGAISSSKRMFFYDGTSWYNDNGSGKNFTISSQTTQEVAIVVANGTTISNEVFYPMIRLNSDTYTFELYTKSNDLTISLGQTVYGGTLDVENGVLVVDRAYAEFDGSEDENWEIGGSIYKYIRNDDIVAKICSPLVVADIITNRLKAVTFDIMYSVSGVNGIAINENGKIYIRVDGYDDLTNYKTWLSNNPIQCVYPLATPITIQLTPYQISLLEGVNNISTTADGIKLTYRDGKVATLGDLTTAVDNLDSKIDESKILTDTATGDKYILVVTNGVLSVEQISN